MRARPQQRTRIDWPTARARMKQAEAALEQALDPPPERARAIMDARARALARAPERAQSAGRIEVVEFSLARERYAIEARFVREVFTLAGFTPVPGTPEFIMGVTNLRGLVLAIVDLRRLFNVGVGGLPDQSRVIVLGVERPEFGILADEARGPTSLGLDDLLVPPNEISGIERSCLRGMTNEAVVIFDGAKLIADERLFHHQSH